MDHAEVLDALRGYFADHVLDAFDVRLEPDTPLLEWGVLTSLGTTKLVGFVRERFDVTIPPEEMVGANFKDLDSITGLILRLAPAVALAPFAGGKEG